MNLTAREAAHRLNVSPQRVRALIASGRLRSRKHGQQHVIRESDLQRVMVRVPGRPRKHPRKEQVAE